jgi:hypothetical protein
MVSSSEAEYVVETVFAETSTIAELIARIPARDRARVLEAAELSYLQIALDLGYAIDAAQLWAKVITSILRIETEKKRWAVRRFLKLLYIEAISAGLPAQCEDPQASIAAELDEPVSIRDDALARSTYFIAP